MPTILFEAVHLEKLLEEMRQTAEENPYNPTIDEICSTKCARDVIYNGKPYTILLTKTICQPAVSFNLWSLSIAQDNFKPPLEVCREFCRVFLDGKDAPREVVLPPPFGDAMRQWMQPIR